VLNRDIAKVAGERVKLKAHGIGGGRAARRKLSVLEGEE
jgi:hypothetical protein